MSAVRDDEERICGIGDDGSGSLGMTCQRESMNRIRVTHLAVENRKKGEVSSNATTDAILRAVRPRRIKCIATNVRCEHLIAAAQVGMVTLG